MTGRRGAAVVLVASLVALSVVLPGAVAGGPPTDAGTAVPEPSGASGEPVGTATTSDATKAPERTSTTGTVDHATTGTAAATTTGTAAATTTRTAAATVAGVLDADARRRAEVASLRAAGRARAAGPNRDTTVLWRGFRHVWSYNHRFNRLGSGVTTSGCDERECYYEVEHTAASGSGEDDATVRDAYTELSAEGVAFHAGSVDVTLRGVENRPKGSQVITGSVPVSVPRSRLDAAGNGADYVALLNGFDTYSDKQALKVVEFDLGVTDPTVSGSNVTFDVTYRALLDCDSVECKGTAGKGKQQVDYPLDVDYLLLAGNSSRLSFQRVPAQSNDYTWDNCKNNKFHTHKWFENRGRHDTPASTFPQNRMNCEQSGGRELDADDYWKNGVVPGPSGYSVATVGMQSFRVELHEEAHFTQWDAVVGGDYDQSTGRYDLRALPFFKEWSSRPGRYTDAKFSYGFEGEADVSLRPVVVRLKHGCKRSFVEGGRIHWATSHKNQKPASSRDAVQSEDHSFEFGDHWRGYAGRGDRCVHDEAGRVPETVDRAYLTNPWASRESDREVAADDPTRLRLMPSDRFYHEKTNPSPRRTDLSDLEVRFDSGVGNPAYAGYGGPSGAGANYSSREAGIYLSGVTMEVGGRASRHRTVLRRVGGDENRRVGSSTGLTTPGVYGLETVVESSVRTGSPEPAVGAAATTFEVVGGPGGVYDHVDYKFDGSIRRVDYWWNTSIDQWSYTNSRPNNFVRGTGQNPHTFVGRFRPRVSPQNTRTWETETHVRWDGSEIEDRKWIYDYGNHTIEIYACHNPAAGDCSDPTVTVDGNDGGDDEDGRRRYGGKSKSGSTATPDSESGSASGGSDASTRVRSGVTLVGRHRITILPFGPDQLRGASVPDAGGLGSWAVGNERVDVRVVEAGEPTFRYHGRLADGTVTEFARGPSPDPTVRVTVEERTIARAASADDPRAAIVDEYRAGNVSVEGVGFVSSVKIGTARTIASAARTVGSALDGVGDLLGLGGSDSGSDGSAGDASGNASLVHDPAAHARPAVGVGVDGGRNGDN